MSATERKRCIVDKYFLRLKCYHCGAIMEAWDHSAGKRSRCPKCDAPLKIPHFKYFEQYNGQKVLAIKIPDWREPAWKPEDYKVEQPDEEPVKYVTANDSAADKQPSEQNKEPSVLTVDNSPTVTQPEQKDDSLIDPKMPATADNNSEEFTDDDDLIVEDLDFVEPGELSLLKDDYDEEESDFIDFREL